MQYVRLYNTLKYLKIKQVYFRIYYTLRAKLRKIKKTPFHHVKNSKSMQLNLQKSIHVIDSYSSEQEEFSFLNLSKKFDNGIDWNYSQYGKLWTYNLTYFDYLSQENQRDNIFLMESFIDDIENIQDGLEAFPISLRGINWIKYLSLQEIKNQKIDNSLYAQYYILLDNLEYHLLGNHLLENGFSLLFGAYYFKDETLYEKAKKILEEELEEQILKDGGHFELSPMYHQIMLFRVLDCINLLQNNSWKDNNLEKFLVQKSELMLGWLKQITYKNGDIPLLNDSTNGIAPTSIQLFEYAKRLDVGIEKLSLSSSGYRKIVKDNYECIVDVGQIGADYIPGHVHSDTFSFELRVRGKPFIVDTGLSTYETNERRTVERSTALHNTVEINGQNQSDVWGGFRVANRANIVSLEEGDNYVKATHDGYKKENILHTRKWNFDDFKINIEDTLNKESMAIARFHFHPFITKEEILEKFITNNKDFRIITYSYSPGFNNLMDAFVLEVPFTKALNISISI